MFFLFSILLHLENSNPQELEHFLSQEEAPEFVQPDYTPLVSINDHQVSISSTVVESSQRGYAYNKCEVSVTGPSTFKNNYALGGTYTSGFGGALYLYESVFQITSPKNKQDIKFQGNVAALGGAICLASTATYLSNTIFTANRAYKHGGAIYFENKLIEDGYIAKNVQFLATSLSLTENTASEYGGAIFFYLTADVYIERSLFNGNRCSFAGGAIGSMNVDSFKLNRCIFSSNLVNADQTDIHVPYKARKQFGENIDLGFSNKITPTRFLGRGGGAIAFFSNDKKGHLIDGAPTNEQRTFESHHCCFYKDSSALTGQTFGSGPAHEMLLDGYINYLSYDDYIGNFNPSELPSQYVSQTSRNWPETATTMKFLANRYQSDPTQLDLCVGFTDTTTNYTDSINYSYASPSNDLTESSTSSIPTPSAYSYVATPITALPRPTDARITYTTAKAKVESASSYFKPSFISFVIPPPTPVQTVASTPHSTPYFTVFSTPHSTPHNTPFNTVFSTASKTAFETPFSTAHSTAHSTPHSTPHSTAHDTPFSTVHSTPHSTPFSTAHSTPHSTAHDTPYSTPHSTAHVTPHSTPHSTAHDTPVETIFSTPFVTFDETPYRTPDTTPAETADNKKAEGGNTDKNDSPKKRNWLPIILGIVGALLLIGSIIFFVLWKRKKDDSSQEISESSMPNAEEAEKLETYISSAVTITNDNPLWISGATMEDPFEGDFEERECPETFLEPTHLLAVEPSKFPVEL